MTTSNDQLSGWTENKSQSSSQSQTYTKKTSRSLFSGGQWWSTAGLIHYSFMNPGKTIISENYTQQILEMH